MIAFHTPQKEDRLWVQPILAASGGMGSEDAFGTFFLWSSIYDTQIGFACGQVLVSYGKGKNSAFAFPVGAKNNHELSATLHFLMRYAEEKNERFCLWGMTSKEVEWIKEAEPDRFRFENIRKDADYIYKTENLAELKGRKYHGKRNHIAQFTKKHEYKYEPINLGNFEDCLFVADKWLKNHPNDAELASENRVIHKAFSCFSPLCLSGGLLRVDGNPAAIAVGEEINSGVYVQHFEKALDDYNGIYAVINNQFAIHHLQNYEYVNREEDMGIEGLRKAKLSYHPDILLEKFAAFRKDE